MKRFAVFCCLPLVGCASSVVGEWEGVCDYTVSGQLFSYEVAVEVEDVKKGEINGEGEVVADEMVSTGVLDGSREGKDVTLEITFTDGVNEKEVFELIGEVNGREILGDFSLGSHTGDCELERDD